MLHRYVGKKQDYRYIVDEIRIIGLPLGQIVVRRMTWVFGAMTVSWFKTISGLRCAIWRHHLWCGFGPTSPDCIRWRDRRHRRSIGIEEPAPVRTVEPDAIVCLAGYDQACRRKAKPPT